LIFLKKERSKAAEAVSAGLNRPPTDDDAVQSRRKKVGQ